MGTQNGPLAYAIVLGTSSVQILPQNPSRKGLMFFNASNNTISICPALLFNGQPLAAVVNGPGSMSIVSFGLLVLPQPGVKNDPGLGAAFNGIASGAGSNLTIWEF